MTKQRNMVKFIVCLAAAVALTWLAAEPDFSQAQTNVLFLTLFSIGLWLTEAVPPFSVAFFIFAFLALSLGLELFTDAPRDVKVYLQTFSSSVIWLMMGGFFLASAMTKTKLDADLIRITMTVCGTDPKRILFGLMLVTMVFSMLISNTATTAMVIAALMPLLVKLGKQSPVGKGLVLGIPIAATTGGMGTVLGTPPNAIAVGALAAAGRPVDFLTWMLYGFPVMLFLTWLSWRVLVRVYMKDAVPVSFDNGGAPAAAADPPGLRTNRRIVLAVLSATMALWFTSPFHGIGAAAVSAIPLVLLPMTRVLGGADVRAIGWDTLLLVAGGLALGTALQQTGLLDHYAGRIAALPVPDAAFYVLLAYGTMAFSNIMSHTATSTVLIPLGMAILPERGLEVAMIIALSSSTALFLPVSTPPNAIAYSTGMIELKDFRLGGALIGLLGPALIIGWVLLIS